MYTALSLKISPTHTRRLGFVILRGEVEEARRVECHVVQVHFWIMTHCPGKGDNRVNFYRATMIEESPNQILGMTVVPAGMK